MKRYIKANPEFEQIGSQMLLQWQVGVKFSLKSAD